MKKKTYISILFLTTFLICRAQSEKPIVIGKHEPFGVLAIKCEKYDDGYVFVYRNARFTHNYDVRSFKVATEDIDYFYDKIMSAIKENTEKQFVTPETHINILPNSKGVTLSVWPLNSQVHSTTIWLAKKKVDKVFGKKA